MSAHVGEGSGDVERSSQMLTADSVKSLVTINLASRLPKSSMSVDLRRRRQHPLRYDSEAQQSTSVAASSFLSGSNEDDATTTLLATCNGGATGRIHLATIIKGPGTDASRSVTMKYSSKLDDDTTNLPFSTVSIAKFQDSMNQSHAAILAIDVEGRLYSHCIEVNESTESDYNNHLFDMEFCVNEEKGQKSPKRGRMPKSTASNSSCHPFKAMNTLTARMESATTNSHKSYASENNSLETPCSTPNQKGRKRKATTSPGRDVGRSTIYAVASSLNESHLRPSQSPPVIIRLSFDQSDLGRKSKVKEVSWAKVPGLEHVHSPMTCISFASRHSCGSKVWKTLILLMKCDEEGKDYAECDAGTDDKGIIIMGFQNGSLYATTVVNGVACHTSKILQLSNSESFLSLQVLCTGSTESKLICVGSLGTLLVIDGYNNDAPKVSLKRLPFHGRFCSMACVRGHKSASNDTDVSLIGTNDTGKMYLFQLSMKCKDSFDKQAGHDLQLRNVFCIPITGGKLSSVSTRQSEFVWTSPSGRVRLIQIAANANTKREIRPKHSILAMLRRKDNVQGRLPSNRTAKSTNTESKYEAITQTLTAAMNSKSKGAGTHSFNASLNIQSNQAATEIRDAIRIVSLSSSAMPPPIESTINVSKSAQGFDLTMNNEKVNSSSSWHHAIHTMSSTVIQAESIKDMTPLCYRRARDGLVKVLYGGSSASLSCQNKSSMHVSMYDFAPVSMYASLSKVFTENENTGNYSWKESVTLDASVDILSIAGQAKRTHMQGIVVPFKLGRKASIPLAGDTFAPILKFADFIRVDGGNNDVRIAAEKEVQRLMQADGGKKSFLATMVGDSNGIGNVHCSSGLALLASSKNIEQYHQHQDDSLDNAGVVPIALVLSSQKDTDIYELGFAVGSFSNNCNELMSLLPLVRHSIIRYSQQEEDLRRAVLKDECYSRLLSEKKAVKIVKHVDKFARELLSRIEMSSPDDTSTTALLTKCVFLYEIMRTLQFIIG